jgi:GT2 family glycosyltransferase
MISKIKNLIQDRMYQRCWEEYQRELNSHKDPYLLWIKENEICLPKDVNKFDNSVNEVDIAYMEECDKNFSLSNFKNKYLIFTSEMGVLSENLMYEIKKYFDNHTDKNIVYADEDVMLKGGMRCFPWLKPIWSADTLLSFLYFGNIFAIRREDFMDVAWLGSDDYRKNIYDFVLKATESKKCQGDSCPGHLEKVLFHLTVEESDKVTVEENFMHKDNFIGVGTEYDEIKENAFKRRGIMAKMVLDEKTNISYPIFGSENEPLVSIIIPSKDNPKVLKQCIKSVCDNTDYKNYEIIVVDNGSSDDNRLEIEKFKEEYGFEYLYKPMDFNFSKMCNIGVEAAKGEYILLLNDDMEAVEASWLGIMAGQASLAHVGAVGAKLLYPESTKIQHVGITNTIWGPGHKLKQFDDSVSYYYGRNRFIYDMIGVTAACLMIRKELYTNIGGMYEGLAVAYNDVDLCFRLYEMGLSNVQRNDVVLYHHESLSRGDDMQDEKKLDRLKNEQKELYKKHCKLYKNDPYIGTLLNSGDPEYSCRWLEGYELVNIFDSYELKEGKKLPPISKMNQAIMIVVEDCGKENFAKAVIRNGEEKKEYYLVKGWAYVPGVDNARYTFKLLFVNSQGKVWELPLQKRMRKDVAKILPQEKNVELTGFCNWIFDGALAPDTYEIWMTAKDGCSRQILYRNTEKTIVIE